MKGRGWGRMALASVVLLTLGCERKSDGASGNASSAPAVTDRDAKGEKPPAPAPPASATQQPAPSVPPGCVSQIRQPEFSECNERGECMTYTLGPLEPAEGTPVPEGAWELGRAGCVPGLLRLTIVGHPGRLDVIRVRAERAEGKIDITADEVISSPLWDTKLERGTAVGQLHLRGERIESWQFVSALPSKTRVSRIPCESSQERGCFLASSAPQQLAPCEYRVRDLTFTDCNPKPTQTDYPECMNYGIGPATSAVEYGCIPGVLRLVVSGYPGRLDVLFVSTKLLEGGEAEVRLDQVHQSTAESPWTHGAVLARTEESPPPYWGAAEKPWTRGGVLGRLELVEGRVKGFSLQGDLRERSRVPRLTCPGVDGSDADCQLERGSK